MARIGSPRATAAASPSEHGNAPAGGVRRYASAAVRSRALRHCGIPPHATWPLAAPCHAAALWATAPGESALWLRRRLLHSPAPAPASRTATPYGPGHPTGPSPRRRGVQALEQRTPAAGRSIAHWHAPCLPVLLSPESAPT